MRAPGPNILEVYRNVKGAPSNSIKILAYLEKKYGEIVSFRFGPFRANYISSPDFIEQVLLDRETYYKITKGTALGYVLGNGLITSDGDFWLKQRRLIQPVFHKQSLDVFVKQMVLATEDLLKGWQAKEGKTFDVFADMNRLTLDVVNRTLFSTNIQDDLEKISQSMAELMQALRERVKFLKFPWWVPTRTHRTVNRNLKTLDQLIRTIINRRKKLTQRPNDLLTMLMEVEDADSRERMTDQQLKDEIMTLFMAGHETTANALTFTIYLLGKNPEAKRKLQEEIRTVFNDQEISFDHLSKLTYTTQVIKESLRLLPPVWITGREVMQDDSIGGYTIKKGDKVMLSPYQMHRSPRFWKDPNAFRPERFTPENLRDKPKYAFFPFGGGPRQCIGMNYAMMEMQLILAMLYGRYDLVIPEDYQLELFPVVTLRPRQAVPVKLTTLSPHP